MSRMSQNFTVFEKKITDHSFQIRLFLILFFFIIYILASLVPHYNFQTTAWDLGIFNQTIYNYAHGRIGPNTIMELNNTLGDHFELILFIISPLYWLFQSYTLLIVQIIAVILGGIGVYKLIKEKTKNETAALGAMAILYLFYGVFSAIVYDYHNNVVGAMMIPWIFYSLEKEKIKWYYLLLFIFLLAKENMALIGAAIGISLIIFSKKYRIRGVLTATISLAYFFLVVTVIMPHLSSGTYRHWDNYAALGSSPITALRNISVHPIKTAVMFFDQPRKLISWQYLLLAGGILLIFCPSMLVVAVPILAVKFLSNNPGHWGLSYQYSVELAPIVAIGVGLTLARLRPKRRLPILSLLLILNIIQIFTITFNEDKKITDLLSAGYYQSAEHSQVAAALSRIPKNASVSAQNTLVPHLTDRKNIFVFPVNHDSEYVILNTNSNRTLPIKNNEEYWNEIRKIYPKDYQLIFNRQGVLLFKKYENQ